MSKVYIVKQVCIDDGDTSHVIVGVTMNRDRVDMVISDQITDLKEAYDDDATFEAPEYEIEEHELLE